MYVEPVRGMSAAQTKQTVQMTTDTDNTIHAQSTEGEAEYHMTQQHPKHLPHRQ